MGCLTYDVSSSQAAQDFSTSPACDGEDLVSIAAMAWFPPLFLSGTCIPQIHGSYISPQGFHFPAHGFVVLQQVCLFLPFSDTGLGSEGGPWGYRASITVASLSLLMPLHKRCSVPCPQLTHLRWGPPFPCLSPVISSRMPGFPQQSRAVCKCQAPAQSRSAACRGNVNTGTPGYLQNPSLSCDRDACISKTYVHRLPFWFYPYKTYEDSCFSWWRGLFFSVQKRRKHAQK